MPARVRLTAGLVTVLTILSSALIAAPANAAGVPTMRSRPTISVQAGTLNERHGTWTNPPITSYSYQWLRCGSAGNGCVAIPDATAQTYTLIAADVGHTMVVAEVAHNAAGASKPARSLPTGTVTQGPPPPLPPPPPPPPSSPPASALTLVASPAAPVVNQAVTLSAAVTSSDSKVPPSGTVTFLNGSNAIPGCTNEPTNAVGQTALVTCQTSFAASTALLVASFSPNAGAKLTGSSSSVVSLPVGRATTSTSLDVSKTVGVGQSTTYTATVAAPPGQLGTLRPTGSVRFLDGGQAIASCLNQPLTNAGATCNVTYSGPGNHSITAQYGGDANFGGSSAPAQPLTVVKPSPQVLGWITSTMQWTFNSTPSYTNVLALLVNGASGATVTTRCHGRGCPFVRRTTRVSKTRRCGGPATRSCPTYGTLNLTPGFHNRRLSIGAQITVTITRAGWIGKYYKFTVRARRRPLVRIACLAPGAVRPGSRC